VVEAQYLTGIEAADPYAEVVGSRLPPDEAFVVEPVPGVVVPVPGDILESDGPLQLNQDDTSQASSLSLDLMFSREHDVPHTLFFTRIGI
jgi:hypothetical protein